MKPCIIYMSPLKALTNEKAENWCDPEHSLSKYKVVQLTGDTLWSEAERKRQFKEADVADIILMTSELLDSITRRAKPLFLSRVRLLVVDEFHLITSDRGPALEAGLMRFSRINPRARLLFLSATMPNVEDMGKWATRLNGKQTVIIKSEFRPVPSETHYIPHLSRASYYEIEDAKVEIATELIMKYSEDRWLAFVHTKAMGRRLLKRLQDLDVETEFHSAELHRTERRKIELDFMKR